MRWEKVINGYAAHAMMSWAHGNIREAGARQAIADRMVKTFTDCLKTDVPPHYTVADTLGAPLCTALLAFGKEQYDDVVSLMLPLKYDLVKLGGSWAQRQVFSVTLIHAAIRSNQLPLALALIAELWLVGEQKGLASIRQSYVQSVPLQTKDIEGFLCSRGLSHSNTVKK
eukprot:Em0018g146a